MAAYTKFFNALSIFLSSSFDISFDIINASNFLGCNPNETNSDEVSDYLTSLTYSNNSFILKIPNGTNTSEDCEKNTIWGTVGLLLIFAPGLIAMPPVLYEKISRKITTARLDCEDLRIIIYIISVLFNIIDFLINVK